MVASRRRFIIDRCLAFALITCGLAGPLPIAAQHRDKAEAYAILVFLQNLEVQLNARWCERGIPGYRERFDGLFARWSEKHRDLVARGERAFRDEIRSADRSDPGYAKLEQIEKAIAALAQRPRDSSPITLDDRMRALCEQNLEDLEAGLGS